MQTGQAISTHRAPALDFRRAVPIDHLLVWTYHAQRADLVVAMGAGLERIEAAVDGVEWHAASACGCASVSRIGELGCRVDARGGPPGHLHVDAERVHELVQRLDKPVAALLIRHGRDGSAPDFMPGALIRPQPVFNGRGQVRIVYESRDKNRNYGFCPVQWTASAANIEAARQEYRIWWDALNTLKSQLSGGYLAEHRAVMASVAREPWLRPALAA